MSEDLMPVGAEAPRCSEFARELGVLPPGSGLFLERVVLVSVPVPWPKPALKHPRIVQGAAALQGASVRTRLFLCESPTEVGTVSSDATVEVFERQDGQTVHYRWEVENDAVTSELRKLSSLGLGELTQSPTTNLAPTFLICTQGSHDVCCGTTGVALAESIEAERPDYVVRRVSHTGGHRFSPTLLAFPEGRMWAFADMALVDRIANGTLTANDYATASRGWWGAAVGPAQVAENAVRSLRPTQPFLAPTVEPVERVDDPSTSRFVVSVEDRRWHVEVSVARTFPSISCESPGGLPAKPGREFAWTITDDTQGET